MEHLAITKTAIDLLYKPTHVRPLRSAPLPRGVINLLQIVAGDEIAIRRRDRVTTVRVLSLPTSRQTSRSEAATLYEIVSEVKLEG